MKKGDEENKNKKKSINPFEITADGSLGLLALGAVGIKAWKEKRKETASKSKESENNE